MKVDLRIKWDPNADGRVGQVGDLVEVWVQWDCPLANSFRIKGGRITTPPDGVTYQTTVRTDWQQVVTFFQTNFGVVLPAQPSCPGY